MIASFLSLPPEKSGSLLHITPSFRLGGKEMLGRVSLRACETNTLCCFLWQVELSFWGSHLDIL